MRNLVLTALAVCLIGAAALGFVAACSKRVAPGNVSATPPVNEVMVRTLDGDAVIILVMRPYDNPLSAEETAAIMSRVQEELTRAAGQATVTPRAVATPVIPSDARILWFGYALHKNGRPSTGLGASAAAKRPSGYDYSEAEDWFVRQLAEFAKE